MGRRLSQIDTRFKAMDDGKAAKAKRQAATRELHRKVEKALAKVVGTRKAARAKNAERSTVTGGGIETELVLFSDGPLDLDF